MSDQPNGFVADATLDAADARDADQIADTLPSDPDTQEWSGGKQPVEATAELAAAPAGASPATAVLDDRYELGRRLGAGGMAEVFEAFDRHLGRRVAIKVLTTGAGDRRARDRFEREARTLARLEHPNAVAIYDVGEHDKRPYLAMELVEGHTLAAHLREHSPLPAAQVVAIADQILAALAAAHTAGIVHRDVKPSNVLITSEGLVKLADFGIAKLVTDATADVTATGQVIGTAKYLAPELGAGRAAVPQSDLYAVGVILYEMLAGEAPFIPENPIAMLAAHQNVPPPSLTARRADLPDYLVAAVDRALRKEPTARYPNADAMRAALAGTDTPTTVAIDEAPHAAVSDQPTPPASGHTTSPRRRTRRAWLAIPLLFAAGLLGTIFALTGDDERVARSPTSTAPNRALSPRADATVPTAPSGTAPAPTAAPSRASRNQRYASPGGSIVIRRTGNTISLASTTPTAGFSEEIHDNRPTRVEVRFESDDDEWRIRVELRHGQLVPEIRQH